MDPDTTYNLSHLTRLTKVSFASHLDPHRSDYKVHFVDLSSLQDLPLLPTLQLDDVPLQILSPSKPYALAALTQLRALRLTGCITRDKHGHIADELSKPADVPAQNFAALPQLTQLQVIDSHLWVNVGLTNLQQVRTPGSQSHHIACGCFRHPRSQSCPACLCTL